MSRSVLLVVGAGPGVGASVARRFARDDHDVALLGRDEQVVAGLADALTSSVSSSGVAVGWAAADLTDVEAATAAITRLGAHTGRIDVLHFNPSAFRQQDPLALSVPDLLADVALGVGALLTAVRAARPFMSSGGRVVVTGSMAADEPWHEAASLGVQKAGVRNLVQSLDATLAPDGIRAVSLTVRGSLAAEGPFSPDRVAEAIHAAVRQPEETWRTELPHPG
jgi:NAD(P)-dependent dehydrogenase (short-subunit alcohol dehydrogenase family)